MYMKKPSNKYYNNSGNNNHSSVYSLNYKFDSTSPAGKFCGTALDLIRRYNDLAKEAQGNANYVEAEVFRQYAEHYRKIVTDINERRNQNRPAFNNADVANTNSNNLTADETNAPASPAAAYADVEPVAPSQPVAPVSPQPGYNNPRPRRQNRNPQPSGNPVSETETTPANVQAEEVVPAKREFKVIEISQAEAKVVSTGGTSKPARETKTRRKPLSVAML